MFLKLIALALVAAVLALAAFGFDIVTDVTAVIAMPGVLDLFYIFHRSLNFLTGVKK